MTGRRPSLTSRYASGRPTPKARPASSTERVKAVFFGARWCLTGLTALRILASTGQALQSTNRQEQASNRHKTTRNNRIATRRPARKASPNKIAPEDWSRFARDVREGRTTAAEIRQRLGLDRRTVKKHLARGLDDLAFEQARSHVFERALEQHFNQLTEEARRLRAVLEPGSANHLEDLARPIEGGWDADRRRDALRAHLPQSRLWRGFASWRKLTSKVEDLSSSIRNRARVTAVDEDLTGLGLLLIDHAESLILTGAGLRTPAGGWQPREVLTQFRYGKYGWPFDESAPADNRIAHEQRRLEQLLRVVSDWPEIQEGRTVCAEIESQRLLLTKELETIALRLIVPGTCPYCPGSQNRSWRNTP